MSVIGSNILAGASGQGGGYNLTKSLRFRSSASASLSRTPASATNRKTWTWSAWVKRGQLGIFYPFLQANYSSVPWFVVGFSTSNAIEITQNAGSSSSWESTAVFRDCSAWYHIVCVLDTTSATSTMNGSSTDRIRLYVNGIQYVITGGTIPTQNSDLQVNNNVAHTIGGYVSHYGDGYLTEVNFIDGQALTPSSFGETSTTTGVWIPKKYTGTYGTNGFYLPFTDTTSTSTLGTDFSGNSNTWTVNNISLTSGSTYDSMTDVPTLTSATTANYATLNPLQLASASSLSNGNLTGSNLNSRGLTSTIHVNTGKFYWEVYPTSGNNYTIGVVDSTLPLGIDIFSSGYNTCGYYTSGDIYLNGSVSTTVATYTSGDVIGVALNCDTNQVTFYKNNTSLATITLTSGISWKSFMGTGASTPAQVYSINFGQQPLTYTPPTGFVALNTFNLPTPTIGATASTTANKYFDAITRNGFGTSGGSVATNFQADLIWEKPRNIAYSHYIVDSVRGITSGTAPFLSSNLTSQEQNANWFNAPTTSTISFNSNDWGTSTTLVDWIWKANGTGVTNTAGSITSTVSANTTAGFSIVTYTGTGANATVGHGLGVAPSMIIGKSRSQSGWWICYHQNMAASPATGYLALQLTNAFATQSTIWNNTAPTSSVFSLGSAGDLNTNGATNVAYCFAPVAGYSAFGSYTGNGSTNGPFVYTGFRPRFFMVKRTDSANDWVVLDTSRNTYNVMTSSLFPNSSSSETSNGFYDTDFLSNGFKIKATNAVVNASGGTYIYMAFAENPFKYANAR